MPVFFLSSITPGRFIVTAAILLLSIAMNAQGTDSSNRHDEQIIREIIRKSNEGGGLNLADSFIRVMPDLPYPFIGKKRTDRTEQEIELLDYIRKERSNEKLVRTPERIVISASKDLAYVFGSYTVDYDNLENKHVHNDGSFILIFKKKDNEWAVDVIFNRYNKKMPERP